MRLLNVKTFQFEEFHEPETAKYAILLHRWVDGKEINFQEYKKINKSKLDKPEGLPTEEISYGVAKIAWSASIAKKRNLDYIWIDTYCIDKTNSVEQNEAINSMFKCYQSAVECYAYLLDVSWKDDEVSKDEFRGSVWFTRRWMLQELLAPKEVRFYDRDWKFFGTKTALTSDIIAATNVNRTYLGGDFRNASIATKMSLASKRTTKKVEDQAYCLLVIFNVSMYLQYSEGKKAFINRNPG